MSDWLVILLRLLIFKDIAILIDVRTDAASDHHHLLLFFNRKTKSGTALIKKKKKKMGVHRAHFLMRDLSAIRNKSMVEGLLCRRHVFVATKLLSQQIFVTSNIIWSRQKICRDKHMVVATKRVFCRDKSMLVATKR